MIDKDVFCSSPWLHLRLAPDGTFSMCRWISKIAYLDNYPELNIKNISLIEYFNSVAMVKIRNELLSGIKPKECSLCYYQDTFGKTSGRILSKRLKYYDQSVGRKSF